MELRRKEIVCLVGMLLFLGVRSGHAEPFINTTKAIPTTVTLSAHDIDIAEVIGRHFRPERAGPDTQFLVIQVECATGEVKSVMFIPKLLIEENPTSVCVRDFQERNSKTFLMPERHVRKDIVIIGSNTSDRLIESKALKREFPRISGHVFMWLPGYNEAQTEAIVYVFDMDNSSNFQLGGWGVVVKLKREDSGWQITSFAETGAHRP